MVDIVSAHSGPTACGVVHVHLGPGPLGQGLVIAVGESLGFELHVIGRPDSDFERPIKLAIVQHGGDAVERVDIAPRSYSTADDVEAMPRALLDAVASDAPLLITAALREGIRSRASHIEDLVRMRPPGSETVFIACENAPDPTYSDLKRRLVEQGVECPTAVVNRVCLIRKGDKGTVWTHQRAEWLIEAQSAAGQVLQALSRSRRCAPQSCTCSSAWPERLPSATRC